MPRSRRLPARDLALVATFAALIAALGLAPGPLRVRQTRAVTLQTLGVMLAGSLLGWRRGALAVALFLLLVACRAAAAERRAAAAWRLRLSQRRLPDRLPLRRRDDRLAGRADVAALPGLVGLRGQRRRRIVVVYLIGVPVLMQRTGLHLARRSGPARRSSCPATSARRSSPRSWRPACTAATRRWCRSASWSRPAVAEPPLLLAWRRRRRPDGRPLGRHSRCPAGRGARPVVARAAAGVRRAGTSPSAAADGRLGGDDLVLFTSGSSGRPRGVVRTVASWQASVAPADRADRHRPGGRGLAARQRDVDPEPVRRVARAARGGRRARAGGWPRDRRRADATALHAAPRVLAAAARPPSRALLPRVRTAVVAGAALPRALRRRAERLGWRLVEYYGAAELSFVAWRGG